MRHVIYDDEVDYGDLGDSVDVELKLIGSWLYIETPIERKAINESALRYDGVPLNVLDFVLKNAGELITIFHLEDAGIKTSRDLRQIALHAGIKGYVRDFFMPVCDKQAIKLLNKVTVKPAEAEALLDSIY